MTDNNQNLDPTTAASLEAAQRNAGGVPTTSGDLAPDASGFPDSDRADDIVAWLTEDGLDAGTRAARADMAEQHENDRSGDNRATVMAAIDSSRDA